MAKSRRRSKSSKRLSRERGHPRSKSRHPSEGPHSFGVLVHSITLDSIRKGREFGNELRRYAAQFHAELASQRAEIEPQLLNSLASSAQFFVFQRWQRRVTLPFSDRPLSARGSVLHGIGGRFNVGGIDPGRFPPFPALYIASDQPTALEESLGDVPKASELDLFELALQRRDAFTMFSLSGKVNALDTTSPKALIPFVECIKSFKISPDLARWAKKLGNVAMPRAVRSVADLLKALQQPAWRRGAYIENLPSQSQIFGGLVEKSGIEAIRYHSVKSRRPCLAVFPRNFAYSKSYVQLDEIPPRSSELISRLDSATWQQLV
jgi:hypothetical protein